jgi:hypothetical protein
MPLRREARRQKYLALKRLWQASGADTTGVGSSTSRPRDTTDSPISWAVSYAPCVLAVKASLPLRARVGSVGRLAGAAHVARSTRLVTRQTARAGGKHTGERAGAQGKEAQPQVPWAAPHADGAARMQPAPLLRPQVRQLGANRRRARKAEDDGDAAGHQGGHRGAAGEAAVAGEACQPPRQHGNEPGVAHAARASRKLTLYPDESGSCSGNAQPNGSRGLLKGLPGPARR